ncbi:Putative ribonuclease H protein At1g65750 [Linum perenne]
MSIRLDTWKAKFLSFGGRLVLIKSVLSSLPVYYLSLFKAPSSVITSLERIQNRFLWSGVSEIEKIHWINWNLVKTPRAGGGLGVQDLRILNTALLSKWHWRFAIERSAWWRELITDKCGVGSSEWQPTWQFSSAGLSLWKGVISVSSTFWSYGFIDPGGGLCAFWFDYWIKGVKLVSAYPRIAAAARCLDVSVSNVVSYSGLQIWDIPLRFQLRGGALTEWHDLLRLLGDIPQIRLSEGPACITWSLQSDGLFSVSSLRRRLTATKYQGSHDFPADVVWQPAVPSKIVCLCWKIFHRKVATIDNLQRKGFSLANRCVLCESSSESVDHLFIRCVFSSEVWSILSSKLSIHGPFPLGIADLIEGWKGLNCTNRFSSAKKVILHSVLWYIWAERNDRVFRDTANSPMSTLHKIWFAIGNWLRVDGSFSNADLIAWRRLVFDNG